MANKEFWNLVKPFLTNKGGLSESDYLLVKDDRIITNGNELVEAFNYHYINIVEKSSGKKPQNLGDKHKLKRDKEIIQLILEKYANHPSILAIVQNPANDFSPFSFHEVQPEEITYNYLKILIVKIYWNR